MLLSQFSKRVALPVFQLIISHTEHTILCFFLFRTKLQQLLILIYIIRALGVDEIKAEISIIVMSQFNFPSIFFDIVNNNMTMTHFSQSFFRHDPIKLKKKKIVLFILPVLGQT